MLKSKQYNVDPTKVNLIDFIMGLNNAWYWWEMNGNVKVKYSWNDIHKEYEVEGSQVVDHFIGLISEFGWQELSVPIHAEFEWEDARAEASNESHNSNSEQPGSSITK